jgi:hypothetical protein
MTLRTAQRGTPSEPPVIRLSTYVPRFFPVLNKKAAPTVIPTSNIHSVCPTAAMRAREATLPANIPIRPRRNIRFKEDPPQSKALLCLREPRLALLENLETPQLNLGLIT